MALYAFFYDKKLDGKIDLAVGDRSAIQLDGRASLFSNNNIAKQECIKRGYVAYKIYKGEIRNFKSETNDLIFV